MRLLFINMFYPPQNAATSHYLGDMCQALAARGHHISVICSKQDYLEGTIPLPSQETRNGVSIKRLWGTGLGKKNRVRRLCDYAVFWGLSLLELLRRPGMDAVICLTSPPMIDLAGLFHRTVHGSRLVIWSMDCYPEMLVRTGILGPSSLLFQILRRLRLFAAKRTDLGFALDQDMKRHLESEGLRRVVCLRNWGDESGSQIPEAELAAMKKHLAGDTSFLVLYAGNLGPPHEFITFLDIAEAIIHHEQVRFVFRGGGELWEPLQNAVRERNLSNVQIAGYLPKEQMPVALQAADLLLMCLNPEIVGVASPSKLYGFLLAARPILFVGPEQSETGAAIKASGCGIVVKAGGSEPAVRFISDLMCHPDTLLHLGRAGRSHYEEHYGLFRSAETMEQTLLSLLGK
jgi:glycosyltransferase involved in cell wall biosynthesis